MAATAAKKRVVRGNKSGPVRAPALKAPVVSASQLNEIALELPPDIPGEAHPYVVKLMGMFSKERSHAIVAAHELGSLAKQMAGALKDQSRRDEVLSRVSEFVAESADILSQAIRLSTVVTIEQCKQWGEMGLTRTHAFHLASLQDSKIRKQLTTQAVEEKWTARQLQTAIVETVGNRRRKGAGRKMRVPKSIGSALRQMTHMAGAYRQRHDSIWFGDKYDVTDLTDEEITADTLEAVQAAKTEVEQTKDILEAEIEHFDEMIKTLERGLAKTAQAEARAEASTASPRFAANGGAHKPARKVRR